MSDTRASPLWVVPPTTDRSPLRNERATDKLSATITSDPAEPIHVLVVDDDAVLRATVSGFLEDQGFSVSTAANGVEALQAIERRPPKLVLMDLHMPVMDGWDLVRELRARSIEVRLVVMTGADEARDQAQRLGATAYVPKPVSLPGLVSKLDKLCA